MAIFTQLQKKPIVVPGQGDGLLAYSVDGLLQYGASIPRYLRALLSPYTSGSITHNLRIPSGLYLLPGTLVSQWVSTAGNLTLEVARFQGGSSAVIFTKVYTTPDLAAGIQLPQMPLGNDSEIRVSFSQATNLGFISFSIVDVVEIPTSINS